MKSYSIEIELIDRTGKNLNKDITCSINDSIIKKSKSNTYVYKEKFEESEKKQSISILLDDKELVLDLVLDVDDEMIIAKKTKLYAKNGKKKVEIDRETITEDIAWDIDEKKPFIAIRAIYDEEDPIEDVQDIEEDIKEDTSEEVKEESQKENKEENKSASEEDEKISKIVEKAKKQGGMTYGELAVEVGNASPAQIEVILEKFEKLGINIDKDDMD